LWVPVPQIGKIYLLLNNPTIFEYLVFVRKGAHKGRHYVMTIIKKTDRASEK